MRLSNDEARIACAIVVAAGLQATAAFCTTDTGGQALRAMGRLAGSAASAALMFVGGGASPVASAPVNAAGSREVAAVAPVSPLPASVEERITEEPSARTANTRPVRLTRVFVFRRGEWEARWADGHRCVPRLRACEYAAPMTRG
jgi:hypothetical protein